MAAKSREIRLKPAARQSQPFRATISAGLLVGFLFVGTAVSWFSLPHSGAARAGVMLVIWLNILLILGAMAVEARRRPYSLHLMHLLALFLFLGTASLFQYTRGTFGVAGPIESVREQVLPCAFAVTLWILAYVAAYEGSRTFGSRRRGPVTRFLHRPITPFRASVNLLLALLTLGYLSALGLAGITTRLSASDAMHGYAAESGAASYGLGFLLIHALLLRAYSLVALLAAVLLLARERRARNLFFFLLVAAVAVGTVVANNPFAASRMWFATALIAFTAPFVLRRMKTGWGLVLIAVTGLTVLPSMNELRYMETLDEFADYATLVSPIHYLSRSSDVDSLGMLSLVQTWTESRGHRWGLQMLGSLLFWFPRPFWPGKPIETGAMVTTDLGFDFTNLSPPILSDPIVDFGIMGVPVVAALFGLLLSRLDRAYWETSSEQLGPRVIDCIHPFWLGCVIFLTRGGSFGSLAYTTAFTAWIFPLALGLSRSARVPGGTAEPAQVNVRKSEDGSLRPDV